MLPLMLFFYTCFILFRIYPLIYFGFSLLGLLLIYSGPWFNDYCCSISGWFIGGWLLCIILILNHDSAWRYIHNYSYSFLLLIGISFQVYVSGLPSFNISSNKHHSTQDLRCFLYWVYASVVLGRQKLRISETRDYWIIYRGPGFLAVLWFGSSPTPSPVSLLYRRHTGAEIERQFTDGRRGWEGDVKEPNYMSSRKLGPL